MRMSMQKRSRMGSTILCWGSQQAKDMIVLLSPAKVNVDCARKKCVKIYPETITYFETSFFYVFGYNDNS